METLAENLKAKLGNTFRFEKAQMNYGKNAIVVGDLFCIPMSGSDMPRICLKTSIIGVQGPINGTDGKLEVI